MFKNTSSTLSVDHSDYFWSKRKKLENQKTALRIDSKVTNKKKSSKENTYKEVGKQKNSTSKKISRRNSSKNSLRKNFFQRKTGNSKHPKTQITSRNTNTCKLGKQTNTLLNLRIMCQIPQTNHARQKPDNLQANRINSREFPKKVKVTTRNNTQSHKLEGENRKQNRQYRQR